VPLLVRFEIWIRARDKVYSIQPFAKKNHVVDLRDFFSIAIPCILSKVLHVTVSDTNTLKGIQVQNTNNKNLNIRYEQLAKACMRNV
jgi:hypothetical protein